MDDIPSNAFSETGDLSAAELKLFGESLERAISNAQFLSIFYDNFIHSSKETASFFADVDMPALYDKLARTLTLLSLVNTDPQGITEHLREIGRSHQGRSIPKFLYATWRDSLIRALDACEPEFSPELHAIWLKATNVAISKMHEGYQ